jgi:transcription elongation GreA/GreB family factor
LEALRRRHRDLLDRHAALKQLGDKADRGQLAVAERDLRYVEARLGSAVIPPARDDADSQVGFGAAVTIQRPDGTEQHYRIVGEDEADAEAGLISHVSPLAQALLGAAIDDEVVWHRPIGDLLLTVIAIDAG